MQAILDSHVLVLNKLYQPVHVTSVRRAFVQLYEGVARAVDEQWRTFDFASWTELSAAVQSDEPTIGTARLRLRVPRVILLFGNDLLPLPRVRFSRANIYARDGNRCQYCRRRFSRTDLNLDHVIPRTQGGRTCWENIVCSCIRCNMRKGGRTPEEAGMKLARRPVQPRWSPAFRSAGHLYDEWRPFLSLADLAYWTTELDDES